MNHDVGWRGLGARGCAVAGGSTGRTARSWIVDVF